MPTTQQYLSTGVPATTRPNWGRSVAVLRMRNGTSQSPFRLALGDNPCAPVRPAPGHGYVTTCPQGGGRTSPWPSVEWLDGVSDALASGLCGFGTSGLRPSATPARRPRRRLPGTTGLRFALHGRQRELVSSGEVLEQIKERGYADRQLPCRGPAHSSTSALSSIANAAPSSVLRSSTSHFHEGARQLPDAGIPA